MTDSPKKGTRHVAMKNDRSHGDERRDRGRAGRGVTSSSSRRSISPHRPREGDHEPRPRASQSASLGRDHNDHHDREQPIGDHQPSPRYHHGSRGGSKDASRRPSYSSSRREHHQYDDQRGRSTRRETGDLLQNPHGSKQNKHHRVRGDGHFGHFPPRSPPPPKRFESRSPSQSGSQRKKIKRDHNPSRGRYSQNAPSIEPPLSNERPSQASPPPNRYRSHSRTRVRQTSPNRHDHKPKFKGRGNFPRHQSPRRGRPRSSHNNDGGPPFSDRAQHDRQPNQDYPRSPGASRIRSPFPHSRPHSLDRPPSLSSHSGRPQTSSSAASRDLADHSDQERHPYPPSGGHRSPQSPRGQRRRSKFHEDRRFSNKFEALASGPNNISVKDSSRINKFFDRPGSREDITEAEEDTRSSHRAEPPTSGANSIGVNMSSRQFRGNYNNPHQQSSSHGNHRQQYNDQRQYAQSPPHHTPHSSYHGSPGSQSPYAGGNNGSKSNNGWGQQQQQQQHQYPPQQ
jgi:hypothetical protein